MLLADYLTKQDRGAISRLVRAARIANSTVHDILNGHRLSRLDVAQRISDATGGKVTVADLLLRAQPRRRKRPQARAAA